MKIYILIYLIIIQILQMTAIWILDTDKYLSKTILIISSIIAIMGFMCIVFQIKLL